MMMMIPRRISDYGERRTSFVEMDLCIACEHLITDGRSYGKRAFQLLVSDIAVILSACL